MPHDRFYTPTPFSQGDEITLSGPECHHLTRVIRATKGDVVELVNGKGECATALLLEVQKEKALLEIQEITKETGNQPHLILVQAIPRMNHLEWVIEKGTELGMSACWLVPGVYSEKKELSVNQLQRLEHLTVSAMKQSGRLTLPSIEIKPPLLQWKEAPGSLLFGDLTPTAPAVWDLNLKEQPSPYFLCVGPEKGFAPQEIAHLKTLHATGVHLHSNILRTETAAIAFLSILWAKLSLKKSL